MSSSEPPNGHKMGSDTGWLGIPGHGVGVREVRGTNLRENHYDFHTRFSGLEK